MLRNMPFVLLHQLRDLCLRRGGGLRCCCWLRTALGRCFRLHMPGDGSRAWVFHAWWSLATQQDSAHLGLELRQLHPRPF